VHKQCFEQKKDASLFLKELRAKIDKIDDEILTLIEQREKTVLEIAATKREVSANPKYFVPKREQQIVDRIKAKYKGCGDFNRLEKAFTAIIYHCRLLQEEV